MKYNSFYAILFVVFAIACGGQTERDSDPTYTGDTVEREEDRTDAGSPDAHRVPDSADGGQGGEVGSHDVRPDAPPPCNACCVQGEVEECACLNGQVGIQECLPGGDAFGPCLCPEPSLCDAGEEIECTCPGGLTGLQECLPSGDQYGPCACPDVPVDPPTGDAGGAGGQGGTPSDGGSPSTGGSGGEAGSDASGGGAGESMGRGTLTVAVSTSLPPGRNLLPGETNVPAYSFTLTAGDRDVYIPCMALFVGGLHTESAIDRMSLEQVGVLVREGVRHEQAYNSFRFEMDLTVQAGTSNTYTVLLDVGENAIAEEEFVLMHATGDEFCYRGQEPYDVVGNFPIIGNHFRILEVADGAAGAGGEAGQGGTPSDGGSTSTGGSPATGSAGSTAGGTGGEAGSDAAGAGGGAGSDSCEPNITNRIVSHTNATAMPGQVAQMNHFELSASDCSDMVIDYMYFNLNSPDVQDDSSVFCAGSCTSAQDWYFSNAQLVDYHGGNVLMGPENFELYSNGVIRVEFRNPFTLRAGETRSLSLKMMLAQSLPASLDGMRYHAHLSGIGWTPQGTYTFTDESGNSSYLTLDVPDPPSGNAGTISIRASEHPRSRNLVGGTDQWEPFARFIVSAEGEDAMIDQIRLNWQSDPGQSAHVGDFQEIAIAQGGVVKGSTIMSTVGVEKDVMLHNDPIYVPQGTEVEFEVWAKMAMPNASLGWSAHAPHSGDAPRLCIVSGTTDGSWSTDFAGHVNVRAEGQTSGEYLYTTLADPCSEPQVLRKAYPILTPLSSSSTELMSYAQADIAKWQVNAAQGGRISWKSMEFSVRSVGLDSLSDFRLYKGSMQLSTQEVEINSNVPGDDPQYIGIILTYEEVVEDTGTTYTLRATPTFTSAADLTVQWSPDGLPTSYTGQIACSPPPSVPAHKLWLNTGGSTVWWVDTHLLWSDRSEVPHTDTCDGSIDWISDWGLEADMEWRLNSNY